MPADESLLPVLEAVRGEIPSDLIGGEAYSRLTAVAGMMPEHLTTFWGFECRLGLPDAEADILFQTGNNTRGQRLLAGLEPSSLDGLCERWPAWRNLRSFAALWNDSAHPFHSRIRNIWLEFDAASASSAEEAAEAVGRPSIFFGPDGTALDETALLDLIAGVLEALGETDWSGRDALRAFIASLPDGADLFQVGLMLSRAQEGLRICVRHCPAERIPPVLSGLGWNGDTEAVAAILSDIDPILHRIAMDLDLDEHGAREKLGLECYMVWVEENPEQWRPLLEYVRKAGLLLPQKSEALAAFPGISRFPAGRSDEGSVWHPAIHRKLHHIKLNVVGRRAVEAKAYLSVAHPGIDMGAVRSEGNTGEGWFVE